MDRELRVEVLEDLSPCPLSTREGRAHRRSIELLNL
jgi:hypothetical protein